MKSYEMKDDFNSLSKSEKGDVIADYFTCLISSIDTVSEVVNLSGISNGIYDIAIKLKGENHIRGIQVKSMQHRSNDTWVTNIMGLKYPENTLILLVNYEKTRFGLGFWKDIRGTHKLELTFTQRSDVRNTMKFTDINSFRSEIQRQLQNCSIIYNYEDTILSKEHLMEFNSILKLKYLCEKNQIKFEYNYTNGTAVDVYLNGFPYQVKFSAHLNGDRYQIHLHKEKDSCVVPYTHLDGIQYFIFLIENSLNINEYCDDVFIIPTKVLINEEYIKTDAQSGKLSLYLPPPRGMLYYKLESYWNNFDLIKKGLQISVDPIVKFSMQHKCYFKNISGQLKNMFRLCLTEALLSDKNIEYIIIFMNDGKERLYSNYLFVISMSDFINEGKILTTTQRKDIRVSPQTSKRNHWSNKYWKHISELSNYRCITVRLR